MQRQICYAATHAHNASTHPFATTSFTSSYANERSKGTCRKDEETEKTNAEAKERKNTASAEKERKKKIKAEKKIEANAEKMPEPAPSSTND